MVAFPDSTTEVVLLNDDGLRPNDYRIPINITEHDNSREKKDEAFTVPRVMMGNGNYPLKIESINTIDKLNIPTENINVGPDVVKKVAGKQY